MSKNPAWNAHNETVRQLNERYESSVKPLRKTLGEELAKTEKRFNAKIIPLQQEKKTIIEDLKIGYAEAVMEHEVERRRNVKTAKDVLQAELAAIKSEKEAAVV